MPTLVKLGDFPKVSIQVQMENGSIQSAHLSLDSAFTTNAALPSLIDWLLAYAKGNSPLFPFEDANLTPFQMAVLEAMQKIPFGQTLSYGELAKQIGSPFASRAIGGVCKRNPFPLFIPCHRVIAGDGSIGGFSSGIEIKRRLLEFEGKRFDLPSKSESMVL